MFMVMNCLLCHQKQLNSESEGALLRGHINSCCLYMQIPGTRDKHFQ